MGAGCVLHPGPRTTRISPCPYGAACYNHDVVHRTQFSHPSESRSGPHCRRACKYGADCFNNSTSHRQEFAHPGDRNYRFGMVVFVAGVQPTFQTLWQLFNYHDPEESGHLKQDEFNAAVRAALGAADAGLLETAWCDLGGESKGSVNFARFATWASSHGVDMPIGLDRAGAKRPCRCRLQTNDGVRFRCGCVEFQASSRDPGLCECGHKESMHRSDAAEGSISSFTTPDDVSWDDEGLVQIDDKDILIKLQRLLTTTHKANNNWTRDRGCTKHGVNGPGCSLACASQHRTPVPKSYVLKKAYRNQNFVLWQRYSLAKSAIAGECLNGSFPQEHVDLKILSNADLDAPLDKGCNEWRVFHGCGMQAARSICNSNFRPLLAGTGATWKEAGESKGVPLYGYGIYCAENITKADEYAKPFFDADLSRDVCSAVVVRCVGGRPNVVTTNDIDTEGLRRNIFDGPYHSVLGDRVSTLGKPFREIVLYDKDQCFPEFLLVYERQL